MPHGEEEVHPLINRPRVPTGAVHDRQRHEVLPRDDHSKLFLSLTDSCLQHGFTVLHMAGSAKGPVFVHVPGTPPEGQQDTVVFVHQQHVGRGDHLESQRGLSHYS